MTVYMGLKLIREEQSKEFIVVGDSILVMNGLQNMQKELSKNHSRGGEIPICPMFSCPPASKHQGKYFGKGGPIPRAAANQN